MPSSNVDADPFAQSCGDTRKLHKFFAWGYGEDGFKYGSIQSTRRL
jgi:hypothetical protein